MSSIPKPQNLGELKLLLNNFKGKISESNYQLISQIINEIERSGGINQDNREQLVNLLNNLAIKNGVQFPQK